MKLIVLNGGKHSKKDLLASKLAKNSDCIWVKPYTDRVEPVNLEDWERDDYIHLNVKQLDHKMEREKPLAVVHLGNIRYVFFENQMNASYCVIIGDDAVCYHLKKEFGEDVVTVKVHSNTEEYSERNVMSDEEFDIVYHYDNDDYDSFEAMVESIW